MSDVPLTVLISARNAEATIGRAVRSALAQGDVSILLIDDHSEDQTVSAARQVAGERVRVVRPLEHRGLGWARQTGLEKVSTLYGMWLDADDELLPGRADRFTRAFRGQQADIVSDAAELADGATGRVTGALPIPDFLMNVRPLARLFERNYLPSSATIGFDCATARAVGYDPALTHGEDSDFMLRAVVAGATVVLLDQPGYRLYSYANSLSRDLGRQRAMVRRVLLKHDYETVRRCFVQARYGPRVTAWGLVSFATFREEYHHALELLAEAEALISDPQEVLEPQGPWPFTEAWRIAFHRGTLLLLSGETGPALAPLQRSYALRACPESANNLGVALVLAGQAREAQTLFSTALDQFPGYADARQNKAEPSARRITSHPLRTVASRSEYV